MKPRPWLLPLGTVFGAAAAVRTALYRRGVLGRGRLDGPVISVGNLAVGGRGKTPVVAWIATLLRDHGVPVAVLSRGYRGSFGGEALLVSDGARVLADAGLAGDEPVMLARELAGVVVAVGKRRLRVGRSVEERFGARAHVLDDGFQHLALERDLDVLCLDPADLEDRPLPAGRLRERPAAAARADVVLLGGDDAAFDAARRRLGAERTFRLRRVSVGFACPDGAPRPAPARAFLLSGIAGPERFESDVSGQGTAVTGHACFGDHHRFLPAEVAEVAGRARASGADALVTTAKDAVRLAGVDGLPLLVFRTAVRIDDDARLRERILAVAGALA